MSNWRVAGYDVEAVVDQPVPTLTRGSEITLQLLFDNNLTDSALAFGRGAYGQFPYDQGGLGGVENSYLALRKYGWFAPNSQTTGTTDAGVPWFSERIPSDAYFDTLVISVESIDVPAHTGFWALVTDVTDQSRVAGSESTARRLDFNLFVLAELREFDTADDVKAEFENTPI
ncbi:hypothetical protein EL22_00015 [Halostagnicola sp. A56]|uniref:hypothetical protein n=1 Tax=Halostagnicola sp. A56 TaxID=1495067 RepID=UPI0004A016A9|nr:hypothetical protein [Halostagnicola sp. A56]KDE60613.1 hypothetical protein EL22_00015 [Halostagnicola sp. A56]